MVLISLISNNIVSVRKFIGDFWLYSCEVQIAFYSKSTHELAIEKGALYERYMERKLGGAVLHKVDRIYQQTSSVDSHFYEYGFQDR